MQSAIVYVVMPSEPYRAREKSALLLAGIARLEHNQSVTQLGEFVWQINFRESPYALAQLVVACEQLAMPYGILPLDADPQWIRVDPNPHPS